MEATAEHLLRALGIEAAPGSEEHAAMVDENPTIAAFLNGEITFAEAVFIETYLGNGFNHKKAAMAAKYRALSQNGFTQVGWNLLRRPKIRALLAERIRDRVIEADEVLARYRDVADGSLEEFISIGEDGHPVVDMSDAQALHLLKEIKFGKDGEVSGLKLRDPDHALDQLARSLGVFEKDHTINIPPELLHLLTLTPSEREARELAYNHMEQWDAEDERPRESTGEPDPAP